MDANGTRYKLLLGRDDWARCTFEGVPLGELWQCSPLPSDGVGWDVSRHELTLAASPWMFPAYPSEKALHLTDRRGAAMDRYGNWYWIDGPETGILVTSSGSGRTTTLWPVPEPARVVRPGLAGFGAMTPPSPVCPGRLRGLAVTEDHYLVVGTLEPAGLLVFDLRIGGPPWHVTWPADVPFQPLDIAARPGGGLFVLDGVALGEAARAWRLDRHFMVEPLRPVSVVAAPEPPAFGPLDGAALPPATVGSEPVHRLTLDDAMPLAGNPIAIDIAGEDLVVVLDRRPGDASSVIHLYDAAMQELAGSPRELGGLRHGLVAHDMAVIPSDGSDPASRGQLFVTDTQGDQAYRFQLTDGVGALAATPDFHPMRLFDGRGLVATSLGVWYDSGDRWIPLVAQRRPRYAERAVILTEIFDGIQPGCVWHRLLLDGCLTAEAQVRVWSAASDDRLALAGLAADDSQWREEPRPYRRGDGPERPFVDVSADDRYGTHELLFQAARGRYLRLKIELTGDRRTSPRIRSLRVWYPRFSYLAQYLPGVYREDAESASFLDGFLANFEGFYTSIEDRIAAAQVLFDPRSAPPEALDWLAGWFDVVMDAGWDEDRRRLFIRHAMDLFRWRGTERGLRMALGLALLTCPDDRLFATDGGPEPGGIRIVERFQTKQVSAAVVGDPTDESVPRETVEGSRWTPNAGSEALHRRYRDYLARLTTAGVIASPVDGATRYDIVPPADDRAPAWRLFSAGVLGFIPSATPDDRPRWIAFLTRRYVRVGALNLAYGLGPTAFATFNDVPLPATLPADGAPLADWYAFENVVLRGVRAAHRFSVLLPVPIGRAARGSLVLASDARDREAEQRRVQRLTDLQKPAHTVFDVKSYWLAFRLGEARLGKDTLLDFGSRSPDLRPPAVLGSMYVGEGVLTSAMADFSDRPAEFSGSVNATTRRVSRRTDG